MTRTQDVPAFCTQCRSRCGCVAHVAGGRLTGISPAPGHPSGEKLCPKGKAAPELVYHPDRLLHPMRRVSPRGEAPVRWERISWGTALDEIAGKLGEIRDRHGPEQVAFSVTTPSGTHMSDGIAWVERFIRGFGSPNLIYSTEICNWHKDFATRFTYGTDIGTPDFARSDCMILWGHNPAATWLARSVEVQKAMKRGAKLIVVDPRATMFARRADCWLRVRPGTDQALALGLLRLMLEEGGFDASFARRWSNAGLLLRADTGRLVQRGQTALAVGEGGLIAYDMGAKRWLDDPDGIDLFGTAEIELDGETVACHSVLSALRELVADFTPGLVQEITGVPEADLRQAAAMIGGARALSYYCWNGVAQSLTATQTDRAISILYALSGHYGQEGGNVPGGAARFNDISGLDLLTEGQTAKALGRNARPLGPGRTGWTTAREVYDAALGQGPYPVRALVSFGGNLLAAQPDSEKARATFDALELHVHADFFLNPTAEQADIVLPVATSWEREGLRTGFDASLAGQRRVQLRPAVIAPLGEARSDIDIALALAERLGMQEVMFGCDVAAGHAHALAPSGVTLEALRANPEGIELPGEVPLRAHETAGFPTPSGLVEVFSDALAGIGQPGLPEWQGGAPEAPEGFPVQLSCAKSVSFCHSQHRNIPSLRRLTPHPPVELSADVAKTRGIADGDWVEIRTPVGRATAQAKVVAAQAPNTAVGQHGWWVAPGQGASYDDPMAANLNRAMVTAECDPISGSIPLRSSWCEVVRL